MEVSSNGYVDHLDKIRGVLFGTALGDALGFPCENLSAKRIHQIFGRVESFRILGDLGYGTDDTEQTALLATAILRSGGNTEKCVAAFKRSLAGWFLRLPFSAGAATLKACLKILLFIPTSGMKSAGNGSAMRASIVGVIFWSDTAHRNELGSAIARTTHTDQRAVDGALFCANFAAVLCKLPVDTNSEIIIRNCKGIIEAIKNDELKLALKTAVSLAESKASIQTAIKQLKITGYVVHTLSFALFCTLRFGDEPFEAIVESVNAGGDADSIGAITGAWVGAWHGASKLPQALLQKLNDGPFGKSHLENLAKNLAAQMKGQTYEIPDYNWFYALLRNAFFIPVILAHLVRRCMPF
jgi:ADP-ribosyl-[dinitrogen reductase] hydrolase